MWNPTRNNVPSRYQPASEGDLGRPEIFADSNGSQVGSRTTMRVAGSVPEYYVHGHLTPVSAHLGQFSN